MGVAYRRLNKDRLLSLASISRQILGSSTCLNSMSYDFSEFLICYTTHYVYVYCSKMSTVAIFSRIGKHEDQNYWLTVTIVIDFHSFLNTSPSELNSLNP